MRASPLLFASPLLIVLAALAACSRQSPDTPRRAEGDPAMATTAAAASASSMSTSATGSARAEKEENDLYDFGYAYPAAAGGIADLKAYLDADLARQKAELIADAKTQRAERAKDKFDYFPLARDIKWDVVTNLPRWLSLSATIYSFEGGAHPNHGYQALLWDRQGNRRRDGAELFVSKPGLSQAIRKPFCAALDRERGKRRGAPVNPDSGDEFDACIDPVASTVILGSSNGKAFDRIGILVAPYEAGPYAEGDYEITLPVTDAVIAAVKPEYRPSFASRR